MNTGLKNEKMHYNANVTTHTYHDSPSSSSPLDPNQYSWGENYAGSSGLMSVSPDMNPMQRARSGTVSRSDRI